MKYYVYTGDPEGDHTLETKRTDLKAAEQDCAIFRWLKNARAYYEEVETHA